MDYENSAPISTASNCCFRSQQLTAELASLNGSITPTSSPFSSASLQTNLFYEDQSNMPYDIDGPIMTNNNSEARLLISNNSGNKNWNNSNSDFSDSSSINTNVDTSNSSSISGNVNGLSLKQQVMLNQFVSIAGCSLEQASQLLSASNWQYQVFKMLNFLSIFNIFLKIFYFF
jgi:hypothetical protein